MAFRLIHASKHSRDGSMSESVLLLSASSSLPGGVSSFTAWTDLQAAAAVTLPAPAQRLR